MLTRTHVAPVLTVLALAAAGCTASTKPSDDPFAGLPFKPAGPHDAPDPSKMGPYPVGVMTYEGIYDTSRQDQWGNARHIVTEVWYPATEDSRGMPGKGYDLEDLMTDQERTTVQQNGITIPLDQTIAVENAAPRLQGGPYPLVIFSHGQAGIRWQSTYYTVMLASHGYVVVAPDHPGDTLQDAFALGNDPPLLNSFLDRELDVAFLISYFTCIDQPSLVSDFKCLSHSDLLWGMTPTDPANAPIGVTGHSYGALTSLRAGLLDPRVKAIVPQAPTSAAEALIDLGGVMASIKTPTLIEGAGKDQTLKPFCDNAYEAYTQTTKPRALVNLVDAGHFTFSDLCQFNLGTVADKLGFVNVSNVINDGCGTSAPPAAVAEPIINNYAIGFFNWQLRGSTETQTKYLTQAAGDTLTPGFQQACQADASCNAGTSCCSADMGSSQACCTQQYKTNMTAGQSTCAQGLSCSPTRNVCEAVELTTDF